MNYRQKYLSACIAALVGGASPAFAADAPSLGTAADFAALGGTGVTCTVPNPALPAVTISGGDVGSGSVDPATVTGFPNLCSLDPGRTPLLGQTAAITDLITAYNELAANTCPRTGNEADHNLSGNLGGRTLSPGVYCMSGTVLLTSQLTLNGGANGIWIFKSVDATTSLTPKGGSVVMAGGGQACNVYWQIGSAVDLLNTAFVGNVLAGTAISFTGEAPPAGIASSLVGRALAKSAVTMTGANIAACEVGGRGGHGNHHGHHHGHDKDKHHGNDKDKHHGNDDGKGHGSGHHSPFGSSDKHGGKSGHQGGNNR